MHNLDSDLVRVAVGALALTTRTDHNVHKALVVLKAALAATYHEQRR